VTWHVGDEGLFLGTFVESGVLVDVCGDEEEELESEADE